MASPESEGGGGFEYVDRPTPPRPRQRKKIRSVGCSLSPIGTSITRQINPITAYGVRAYFFFFLPFLPMDLTCAWQISPFFFLPWQAGKFTAPEPNSKIRYRSRNGQQLFSLLGPVITSFCVRRVLGWFNGPRMLKHFRQGFEFVPSGKPVWSTAFLTMFTAVLDRRTWKS